MPKSDPQRVCVNLTVSGFVAGESISHVESWGDGDLVENSELSSRDVK